MAVPASAENEEPPWLDLCMEGQGGFYAYRMSEDLIGSYIRFSYTGHDESLYKLTRSRKLSCRRNIRDVIHGIEADAKATHLLRTILGAGAESTKIHEVLLRGEQHSKFGTRSRKHMLTQAVRLHYTFGIEPQGIYANENKWEAPPPQRTGTRRR